MSGYGEWKDPNVEVPANDGCVLGIVSGHIGGVDCRRAASIVCYDDITGEWYSWEDPSIDMVPEVWCELPEWPEVTE